MTKRNVLICTAWPYAYATPHLGNFLQLISGGVLKRYYNHTGANVWHVGGSDTWGARMEFEAKKQGISPKEIVKKNHEKLKKLINDYNIDFTNYTWTQSKIHQEFVKSVYKKCYDNGYIITKVEKKPYCNNCKTFLADRFIEGECPHCGAKDAKGNQCDNCGSVLEPEELVNPVCAQCNKKDIVIKNTKHWYLTMDKFQKKLRKYADSHKEWNEITKEYTYRWINKGLQPRPLTRDIKWGIKAPFPGAKGKTIYVWMDAVLGYISASIEHAKKIGKPDEWKKFWFNKCKQVYCQGKDNIPFHTVVFPSILFSTKEKYNLPDQFSSTYFLNWEGGLKFSKTHGVGVWTDEALKILPNPDIWTFYLMINRPEKRDREFSWTELDKTINSTLVGSIGNLFNRCLTFINRYYKKGLSGGLEKKVANQIIKTFKKTEAILEKGGISEAIKETIKLADFGNEYFQSREPWHDEKKRPQTLYNTYQIIQSLTILLEPYLPASMIKAWKMLGLKGKLSEASWRFTEVKKIKINKPALLFKKVKEGELKDKCAKLKNKKKEVDYIKYEDFAKVKLLTAKVLSAEPHGKRLLKLKVIADRERVILAGIKDYYNPKELIGKNIIIVANLEPKKLAGELSEGMLLAAEKDDALCVLTTDREMPANSEIH